MTDSQKSQCKKILDAYGMKPQFDMLVEECSELIQSVCKYKRSKDNHGRNRASANICGEMADVLIMIEQIKCGLGIADSELDASINYKLKRQLERIENHE